MINTCESFTFTLQSIPNKVILTQDSTRCENMTTPPAFTAFLAPNSTHEYF